MSPPTERPGVPPAAQSGTAARRLYSISTVLAVTLALLVLVTVAAVVMPLLYLGRNTTVALLREKGDLVLSATEMQIRQQMDPAANQLAFIAEVLRHSYSGAYDQNRVADILTGALAATPQIASLTFVDSTFRSTTAVRKAAGVDIELADLGGEAVPVFEPERGGKWDGIVREPTGELYIVRREAVYRGDAYVGTLYGHISVQRLSDVLTGTPGHEGNSFVVYDHDYVLVHPRLRRPVTNIPGGQVLPRLDQVGDPVLAAIWSEPVELPLLGRKSGPVHAVRLDGDRWLFLYREVKEYGNRPWLIGTYIRAADALADLRQLLFAGIGAAVALVMAVVAAILIGRRVARPITQLADVARQLRGLRFSSMPRLPRSNIRELDAQVRAFEDMIAALRWFEVYVPRKLVRRLARRGDHGLLPSVVRDVTVMFTDIVGFTSVTERMSPVDTARLLNQHFDLVTRAIEADDGTVDKFIGDAVMAFWGAPSRQRDHAARAVRAAASIAAAVRDENRRRAVAGQPSIRLRIGIHTGPVVVGNIGAEGRINYTIVGDTVNAAQRIEQLGRQFLHDDDVVVLLSGATEHVIGPSVPRVAVGTFTLRGRAEPVPVFRLVLPAPAAAAARAAAASGR